MSRLPIPVSWETSRVLRWQVLRDWAAWWPGSGLVEPTDVTGWMIVGNDFDAWCEEQRKRVAAAQEPYQEETATDVDEIARYNRIATCASLLCQLRVRLHEMRSSPRPGDEYHLDTMAEEADELEAELRRLVNAKAG